MDENEVFELSDLDVFEVSLVPRGANNKKFFMVKNEEGGFNMFYEVLKELLEVEIENEKEVDKILKDYNVNEDGIEPTKALIKILKSYREEFPDNYLELVGSLCGFNSSKKIEDSKKDVNLINKEDISKLEVNDEIKKSLEVLFKQNEEISKQNDLLKKEIEKEKDLKLINEYIGICKEFDCLNINNEEFGKVLKEVSSVNKENVDKIIEVLKSANELVKKGDVFKEVGSSSYSESSSAWDKIEKCAVEIMENEKVSKEVALTRAMERNSDLYDEYVKERMC